MHSVMAQENSSEARRIRNPSTSRPEPDRFERYLSAVTSASAGSAASGILPVSFGPRHSPAGSRYSLSPGVLTRQTRGPHRPRPSGRPSYALESNPLDSLRQSPLFATSSERWFQGKGVLQ